MECLQIWARERGVDLDLSGLELNPQLAAAARMRLPALAHHIYTGNVIDWSPPERFTYVRTGLEYVPASQASTLVARLLDDVVAPGGRLLVGPINVDQRAETVAVFEAAGAKPSEVSAVDRNGKTRLVIWAPAI